MEQNPIIPEEKGTNHVVIFVVVILLFQITKIVPSEILTNCRNILKCKLSINDDPLQNSTSVSSACTVLYVYAYLLLRDRALILNIKYQVSRKYMLLLTVKSCRDSDIVEV